MCKGAKLKFKYDCMTPTVGALKTTANLLKRWSIANSNEGTARKRQELLRGVPTDKRQGFPDCEAATNHCLHAQLQSGTNLQACTSPWESDIALFVSASATGISAILMPNSELPAWKHTKKKEKTDEESHLFPSQLPNSKLDDVSMQEDFASSQEH